MSVSSGRILIADDEPSVRDSVGYALAQEGFEVTAADDGDDAKELLGDGIPFDLLILDIMMPGPPASTSAATSAPAAPSRSSSSPPRTPRSTRSSASRSAPTTT